MSGLLDLLQAASNAIAGNVSGPVDLLNMGLHKVGLGSREPVGGSEWMEKKGLTRKVKQGPAQVVGETLGLLSPLAGSPQVAKGLLTAGENFAKSGHGPIMNQRGAIVYHGSPHKFDKFDSSKIGTGEGAQAYGHGLYLAESPDVAKSYVDPLYKARDATQIGGLPYDDFLDKSRETVRSTTKDRALFSKALAPSKSLEEAAANLAALKKAEPGRDFRNVDALFELASRAGVDFPSKGALYKVDVPDTAIAKMLDWDKPLSQQAPEVQKVLSDYSVISGKKFDPSATGEQIYRQFRGKHLPQADAAQVAASNELKWVGIPGLRYLDGGSRGAGAGTSNYVVFPGEEGLLKILERNGNPL